MQKSFEIYLDNRQTFRDDGLNAKSIPVFQVEAGMPQSLFSYFFYRPHANPSVGQVFSTAIPRLPQTYFIYVFQLQAQEC